VHKQYKEFLMPYYIIIFYYHCLFSYIVYVYVYVYMCVYVCVCVRACVKVLFKEEIESYKISLRAYT
jgi:hypothetical protein